jgi:hypothetical protein
MAYKLGRRKPKKAPALKLAKFLVAGYPAEEDYLSTLRNWQVLGNDRVGDCNAVTWANTRRLVTATLTDTEDYPDQDQVWQFYRTQNPQFDPNGTAGTNGPGSTADGGMEIQTGLEYLHSQGGPDGVSAVAFAQVDPTKVEEVKAALAIFGGLWLGICVQEANEEQFHAGQPWAYVRGSRVVGGHAILGGGYAPSGSGDAAHPVIDFITWGQETRFLPSFWTGSVHGTPLVEEAWIVIWPEHLGSREFQAGIDVNQLEAEYQQLTGEPLKIPTEAGRKPSIRH